MRREQAQIEADWADLQSMPCKCGSAAWTPVLTHGDLLGDNIIVGTDGALHPIDWMILSSRRASATPGSLPAIRRPRPLSARPTAGRSPAGESIRFEGATICSGASSRTCWLHRHHSRRPLTRSPGVEPFELRKTASNGYGRRCDRLVEAGFRAQPQCVPRWVMSMPPATAASIRGGGHFGSLQDQCADVRRVRRIRSGTTPLRPRCR